MLSNHFVMVLLIEEILHQLVGSSLSKYSQGFIHPRWCRISSIKSIVFCLAFFGNHMDHLTLQVSETDGRRCPHRSLFFNRLWWSRVVISAKPHGSELMMVIRSISVHKGAVM